MSPFVTSKLGAGRTGEGHLLSATLALSSHLCYSTSDAAALPRSGLTKVLRAVLRMVLNQFTNTKCIAPKPSYVNIYNRSESS